MYIMISTEIRHSWHAIKAECVVYDAKADTCFNMPTGDPYEGLEVTAQQGGASEDHFYGFRMGFSVESLHVATIESHNAKGMYQTLDKIEKAIARHQAKYGIADFGQYVTVFGNAIGAEGYLCRTNGENGYTWHVMDAEIMRLHVARLAWQYHKEHNATAA